MATPSATQALHINTRGPLTRACTSGRLVSQREHRNCGGGMALGGLVASVAMIWTSRSSGNSEAEASGVNSRRPACSAKRLQQRPRHSSQILASPFADATKVSVSLRVLPQKEQGPSARRLNSGAWRAIGLMNLRRGTASVLNSALMIEVGAQDRSLIASERGPTKRCSTNEHSASGGSVGWIRAPISDRRAYRCVWQSVTRSSYWPCADR
jgi:hypothetical protein